MVISELKGQIAELLKAADNDDFLFEAREIVREVVGKKDDGYILTDSECESCLEMARRRVKGEPLQYIFGHWEFYGYDFFVGEGVLIPRPETELLCEKAIQHLKKFGGEFIDLCSGSGCIGITIAKETGLNGTCVEISEKAFSYLEKNITLNEAEETVKAIKGDIFDGNVIAQIPDNSLGAVLSNPPYINKADMQALQKEVRYEPETALYGGDDGLCYYRKIFTLWDKKLKKGGLFAVEIGEEQGEAVLALMAREGYSPVIIKDYSGHDRIVMATKE